MRLLFSEFKDQEFKQLCQLLCSVFETTPEELAELYQDINNKFNHPGWLLNFVRRDFFKSVDEEFCFTYQKSPVIAVDLPSLMELHDGRIDKPTVAIVGQDSKNDSAREQLVVGTPYGLHHKGSRENLPRTKLYFEMIQVLLELGYRVYLTDLLKIWVCNPDRPYNGINLPKADKRRFVKLIKLELDIVKPIVVITWGKFAGDDVDKLQLNIEHLKFIHPSGAANGAFKRLTGESPTYSNKLNYWRREIIKHLPSQFDIPNTNNAGLFTSD